MLLVVDDLQWAAKPTLLLLRHVLRFPAPMRVLVVGTYRDTDVGRGHPLTELLADLRRLEGAERLPLSGPGRPAVAAFIGAAAATTSTRRAMARPAVWRGDGGQPASSSPRCCAT